MKVPEMGHSGVRKGSGIYFGQQGRSEHDDADDHRRDRSDQDCCCSHIFGCLGQGVSLLGRQINDHFQGGVEKFCCPNKGDRHDDQGPFQMLQLEPDADPDHGY